MSAVEGGAGIEPWLHEVCFWTERTLPREHPRAVQPLWHAPSPHTLYPGKGADGGFVMGERIERRLAAVLAADVAGYSP
jgi:hypothetical protein